MKKFDTNKISLVGLGKLGLCLAAIFAKKGIKTIGIDIDEKVIASVNNGISPIIEPELGNIISDVGGKFLTCTNSHSKAISETDITYILTATPSNPDGSFSNHHVEAALKTLSSALKNNNKRYHLFVISSTVAPGSIENSFIPLIEKYSGRKLNIGFGIGYCPDFVALGEVINNFLNPELVVIGESSKMVGDIIENLHHRITDNKPYIGRMSLISGEIAKISLNTYITTKISFVNNLGNICEKLPGAEIDKITETIGVDKRISPYYFKSGMAYGGTCFPRDTFAFNNLSNQVGFNSNFIDAIEEINEYQHQYLFEIVNNELQKYPSKQLCVLGLSFKTNTPVIIQSSGIRLIQKFLDKEHPKTAIIGVDPLAVDNAKLIFGNSVKLMDNIDNCLDISKVYVLVNNDKKYINKLQSWRPRTKVTVIDCWRSLDIEKISANIKYIPWATYCS